MSSTEDFTFPFKDEQVRNAYLDVVKFLEDDEIPTFTYSAWLTVAKDEAFETLCEEGLYSEYAREFLAWNTRLITEQHYLNRREYNKCKNRNQTG